MARDFAAWRGSPLSAEQLFARGEDHPQSASSMAERPHPGRNAAGTEREAGQHGTRRTRSAGYYTVFGYLAVMWFNFWLYLSTAVIFACCILLLAPFGVWPPRAQGAARRCCLLACGLWWRLPFKLSPWIRVHRQGFEHFTELGASGRKCMILGNHVSFLDTLLFAANAPLHLLPMFATLVSSNLFKLPMLGTIMRSVGHISVPYSNHADGGNFSLEASQREHMKQRINAHLASGGWICMYPEGQIHRGNANGNGSLQTADLQTFRAGGMSFMLDHDMEVWGWVTRGNNDSWPRTGQGGHPANISIKVFPIAQEGAAGKLQALQATQQGVTEDAAPAASSILFAKHAQRMMQEELDALYRER